MPRFVSILSVVPTIPVIFHTNIFPFLYSALRPEKASHIYHTCLKKVLDLSFTFFNMKIQYENPC